MKTAIKTEFICVKPKSTEAEYRFEHDMYKLHSCRVVNRENGKVSLKATFEHLRNISIGYLIQIL